MVNITHNKINSGIAKCTDQFFSDQNGIKFKVCKELLT